ncbi:hypothetical protein A2526_00105 [candidate division WOR-1 bacterium RIFOXYD2_FULL_36_8]|uniref:Uncharacterized protein n=1 Tax=candidate division WOR-1 bacterium RIFOXYB2_FULL_36_35 TaxID=1802578 RepID=A0A1F4S2L7_UNCSA|nr:MAG: hypothetical protein A2230_04660 [candidate division WOR-1 bacterium RIFOXYA2_FULL_36_21]OGC14685.1 MAG: hypothetical protein A2290_01390 [candidate division WOR-1 bacterium RIFOXYB2_FULL_36_35]OGC19703.1 MAG: hypothetical protein A2282_03115 [candidate division WOR-1 bacterium RIFOXYA12_FULL_36_13]OGC39208.1 MAG: hypothetical protein A2526_00105 [candidate division WOR-1 bacterium RIFOXYD2_FULL_36_8]
MHKKNIEFIQMLDKKESKVLGDFFLDCAKLIFASLVVGVFVPSAVGKVPWLTFLMGIIMTALFLVIAVNLSKKGE